MINSLQVHALEFYFTANSWTGFEINKTELNNKYKKKNLTMLTNDLISII